MFHLSRKFIPLLLMLIAPLAWSYQVEPMYQFMTEAGQNSQNSYQINNASEQPLIIEVEVESRSFDAAGQEVLTANLDDFLIMPPQTSIAPGNTQTFRVRYLGQEPLDETTSYRIVFKQLPLQNKTESTGMEILFNISTLVFVAPPQVVGDASVTVENRISQLEGEEAKTEAVLAIENTGNGLIDLAQWQFRLEAQGKTQTVNWATIKDYSSTRYVLPNHTHTLSLQAPWYELSGAPEKVSASKR